MFMKCPVFLPVLGDSGALLTGSPGIRRTGSFNGARRKIAVYRVERFTRPLFTHSCGLIDEREGENETKGIGAGHQKNSLG
jgi:hypothetical protein